MKILVSLLLLASNLSFANTANNLCSYPQSKIVVNSKYVYAQNLCTYKDLKKGNKNQEMTNIKMLYIFEKEQLLTFWTKMINQPIDLIFLNSKLEVVSIHKNLPPNSTNLINSKYPASFALQVEANQSTSLSLQVGQTISIENQ